MPTDIDRSVKKKSARASSRETARATVSVPVSAWKSSTGILLNITV